MRKQKLPTQTETQIKRAIKQLLNLHKIWNFPLLAGLGTYPGLPDMVAIRLHEVWFIEVKTARGKLSEKQKEFRDRCLMLGIKHIVARSPEDVARAMKLTGWISP